MKYIILLLCLSGCMYSSSIDMKELGQECYKKCENNDGLSSFNVWKANDCECENGAQFNDCLARTEKCINKCSDNGGEKDVFLTWPIFYFCYCKNGAQFSDTVSWF